ncbi:hypothetical protein BDY17DRAFT_321430 [Neohortaea acidophila]|uniref:LYR motif-containing protein 2 n=1 Tax=Neohortaea acidophila TaxID=245834 RepID=A0A6A6Q3T5_9PEZI|nr:uncharacterized protein BDY17DRAFT_321430 [Neohortaea acidophila]KAF2486654.1 hypothetical protein BDY17DRAFT_321430 [Neohortaea acidophila]
MRSLRLYATFSRARSLKDKGPVLTLEQFLQKQRVLGFWREIMREVHKIPPSSTRQEMREFARTEFERNRHLKDLDHIRYLVATGKTQLDSMRRYVEQIAR